MYGVSAKPLCLIVAALSLLSSAALAQVQINQNFVPQGPSPSSGPLDIVGSGDAANGATGTVAGAVQAILLDPMLGPNTMFIGSPNGGIWEMTNGGAARPHPMLFGVLAVPVLAVYCQPGARPYRSNGSDSPRIVAS
jgi:hypothetical protein